MNLHSVWKKVEFRYLAGTPLQECTKMFLDTYQVNYSDK